MAKHLLQMTLLLLAMVSVLGVPPALADSVGYVGPLPVSFAPGHILPDVSGSASLSVEDDVFVDIAFSVCNGDDCQAACNSHTLMTGLNWDPDEGLTVSVDGGVQGGDTFVCGQSTVVVGTKGAISHS